jgi:DNA-directed RNA polymerase subunit RPC12/RpoP
MSESAAAAACPSCGIHGQALQWTSYFCGSCGQHNDRLFLEEHPSPEKVSHWNRDDIVAEYRNNGMPFAAPRSGT